jgi:hypothetical protein
MRGPWRLCWARRAGQAGQAAAAALGARVEGARAGDWASGAGPCGELGRARWAEAGAQRAGLRCCGCAGGPGGGARWAGVAGPPRERRGKGWARIGERIMGFFFYAPLLFFIYFFSSLSI